MNVLVTGGAGFIGSHLTDALLTAGHDVTVLDDLSGGKEANLAGARAAGATLHVVDVCDQAATHAVAVAARAQVIFHLAAQVDVRRSVADPLADLQTNVGGTLSVLEAARATGARVVNVSTGGGIYGDVQQIPTPEHVTPRPGAPYGHSKHTAEGYVRLYGELFGVRAATARLGNVYGPRQDPHGEAGVIAIFCGLLEQGGRPTVFGGGRQTRDYVYVGDVVAGLLALLAHPGAHGAYNLGTGRPTTVLQIVDALAAAAGVPFEPVHAPERPGEIEHSCLDCERAAHELGWRAEVALADGLARTVAWTTAAPTDAAAPLDRLDVDAPDVRGGGGEPAEVMGETPTAR